MATAAATTVENRSSERDRISIAERELNRLRKELQAEKDAEERTAAALTEALRANNTTSVQRLEAERDIRRQKVSDLAREVAQAEFELGELANRESERSHKRILSAIESEFQRRSSEIAASAERRTAALQAADRAVLEHNLLCVRFASFSTQLDLMRKGQLDPARLYEQIQTERRQDDTPIPA